MRHFPSGALALAASAGLAVSQQGQPADALELVARAERLFAAGAVEDGILSLWDALDHLGARAELAGNAAGIAAALALAKTHDPLHGDRLAVLAAQARAQVDLAMLYRGKKWLRAAVECLDLADRFDRSAGAKERARLANADAGGGEASILEPKGSLLARAATVRVDGPWREVGDQLECGPHRAADPWYEWTIEGRQGDCELSVEFRPADAKAAHDCALLVGVDGAGHFYQCVAAYYPDDGRYDVVLFEHRVGNGRSLGSTWAGSLPDDDGFHRLTLRVAGTSLRAQLDATPPVEIKVPEAPRGRVGLTVGINNQDSGRITFRNLALRPWPPLSPQEAQARAQERLQQRTAEAIDAAALLIERKENEAAARRLRVARREVADLSGALRDSFRKSIEDLLAKADLLHSRRERVGHDGGRALVALADRYAAAGQVRAAHRVVRLASLLAREPTAARLAAAEQAVAAWQQAQGR